MLRAALVCGAVLAGATAEAAILQRVNKDQHRIIVELSQAELESLEEGQDVVVEVGKQAFVVYGTVGKINVPKKTAVLIFAEGDQRFVKKQSVRFLSIFWDHPFAPQIASYAQFHQYKRSSFDTGLGGFGSYTEAKTSGVRAKTTSVGARLLIGGHLIFVPSLFGGAFAYERRMARIDTKYDGGDKGSATALLNQLHPGLWYEVQPGWTLGLRYDYTAMERDVEYANKNRFTNDYGRAVVSAVYHDTHTEYGGLYKDKVASTAIDAEYNPDGSTREVKDKIRVPAELSFFYRKLASPVFIWGGTFGYVFFERKISPGVLAPKPNLQDLLRARVDFEHRLGDGSKLAWSVYYDGAETPGLLETPKGLNTLGVGTTYQLGFGQGMMAGITIDVEGGGRIVEQNGVTTSYKGFGVDALAFARYEFDATGRSGGTRTK